MLSRLLAGDGVGRMCRIGFVLQGEANWLLPGSAAKRYSSQLESQKSSAAGLFQPWLEGALTPWFSGLDGGKHKNLLRWPA
jgi:hypothetical protein